MDCQKTCHYIGDTCFNERILAYNAAINILAVEYLVKTYNFETYKKYTDAVHDICRDVSCYISLYVDLSHNMHINNLGEMISQGDYDRQKERLLYILDTYLKESEE